MIHEVDKKRRMDGTKLLWNMERVIQHLDKGERVAPIHIDMGLAKFCTVKCVFCFGVHQNPTKAFIKREPLLETMRLAPKIGVKSIGFIGDGEPTCNPHVWDALREGKKNGLDLSISTNGVIVTNDDRREAILESCEWMRFCIAAGTREGYKQIHQRDYFNMVVKNIGDMVRFRDNHGLKCDIGMQSVFIPTIMNDEVLAEARLAVELGVDYFVIKQCSLPDANKAVGDVEFDVNEYDDSHALDALRAAEACSTAITKIIPKWETIKRKGAREYEHCPAVPFISEISGNGDCFPCGYFFGSKPQYDKYKFGNIHEMNIEQIFKSDRYWSIVEHFRNEFDSHKDCTGACRLDSCNAFVDDYLHPPSGKNFI